jgi:hypothetical protein
MAEFTPTPEQMKIVSAARDTQDNLLISALAGAAKTSTLVLIAKALPGVPTLCLSFNKKIAVEMQERLPSNCEAMTLNSLGHRAWQKAVSKRLILNDKKTYQIVKELIEKEYDEETKTALYEVMSNLIRSIDGGKTAGYIPDGYKAQLKPKGLIGDDEFFNWLDEEPRAAEWNLIVAATKRSLDQAFDGVIDYNDQILMPTCFPLGMFPSYPLVLVDEAQDLSALNHAMLRKLVRKRVIAVGDECQSIYGFRGAHEDSMELLAKTFSMRRLILSTSFRCPVSIVEAARWRAPHMQYPAWAIPGSVSYLGEWDREVLPHESTILCRNNAPLFSMAIKLLKAGRYPELVGNDLAKSLIKTMEKLGPANTKQEEALSLLSRWADKKRKTYRDKSKVDDLEECLSVFIVENPTLGDAIAYAKHIFSSLTYIESDKFFNAGMAR